ncbi:MAG: hypothetical protein ACT4QF_19220 [Sporichthyaceae bacterium]
MAVWRGTDPDRASFTTALETAREALLTHRHNLDEESEGLDAIGVAVLATLLPSRRARYSARKVKSATSRNLNREDGRPSASTTVVGVEIVVQARTEISPPQKYPGQRPRFVRATTVAGTPRHFVLALMAAQPERIEWSGRELAAALDAPGAQHAHATGRMGPPRRPATNRPRHLRPRHANLTQGARRQPRAPNFAALLRGRFAILDSRRSTRI